MSRRLIAALMSGTIAFGFTAAAPAQTEFSISLNTGANHIRNITVQRFVDALTEATGGALVGRIFDNGQLYAAPDVARAVARGDVEMGVPITIYLSPFEPSLSVLDLALFSGIDPDAFNAIVDGPLGEELAGRVEAQLGVVIPGQWMPLGAAHTFGAGRVIESYDDIAGMRIRIPGGAAILSHYNTLGANPVVISFGDVPVALSQGTIDGILTTNETIRSAQLWEAGITSGFLDSVQTLFYVPILNTDFWEGLTAEQRETFVSLWTESIAWQRGEVNRRQSSAQADNEAAGIVFNTPSPDDQAAVRERLMATVDTVAADLNIDPAVLALAREVTGQ